MDVEASRAVSCPSITMRAAFRRSLSPAEDQCGCDCIDCWEAELHPENGAWPLERIYGIGYRGWNMPTVRHHGIRQRASRMRQEAAR